MARRELRSALHVDEAAAINDLGVVLLFLDRLLHDVNLVKSLSIQEPLKCSAGGAHLTLLFYNS